MVLQMASTGNEATAVNEFGQPVGFVLKDWSPPPLPSRTTLTGRYCRLEPLTADRHGQDFWNAQSKDTSGARWTYMPYGPFKTFDEFKKWCVECEQSQDHQYYAVVVNDHAVGFVVYVRMNPSHGAIEVGLFYSPALAKTRAATEAMHLLIANAFKLGYRRCNWNCDSCNVASHAAATRFGFTYEGKFRQALVLKGRSCDTTWFSIIDSDWNRGLKEAHERWLEAGNFHEEGQQKMKLSELTAPFVS